MATLLTGGTGFVGRELIKRLDSVSVTSRNRERATAELNDKAVQVIRWDPVREPLVLPGDREFHSVVNLMGESVAQGRWTADKKKRIRESRVVGTRRLVDALIASDQLPRVMVSASAVGFYGDAGDTIVEEDHARGQGFLADVCADWETESMRLQEQGVRVVCLRIGIVIGATGGALQKMTPLFRSCLGGRLGNGRQWMAWIHLNDLVAMIDWALTNESVSGPVNATAPNPVRNAEFTKVLAKNVGRPAILPAPRIALRVVLGEFAESLFHSQRVVPAAALSKGFQFQFTDIHSAIQENFK